MTHRLVRLAIWVAVLFAAGAIVDVHANVNVDEDVKLAAAADADVDALLERLPAETSAEQVEVAAELGAAPVEWAAALCARLEPAGDADDTAVRDALDGWSTHVLRPGAPAEERIMLAAELARFVPGAPAPNVTMFLLRQLGKLGVEATLPAVLPYLADPVLAAEAAVAVRMLGGGAVPPEAEAAAREAMANSEGGHRAALESLLAAPEPELEPADRAGYAICADLTARVDADGEEALPYLVAALLDPHPDVRGHAERLLDALTTPANAAEIHARREEAAAGLRAGGLRRLAAADPDTALAKARERLDDAQSAVRAAALEVYAQLAGPADAGALIERLLLAGEADRDILRPVLLRRRGIGLNSVAASRLADDNPATRRLMLAFLEDRGARAQAPAVLRMVADPDADVAGQAVRTLRRIAGPDHTPDLLALLRDDQLPESLRDGLVPALVGALNELPEPAQRLDPIREAWPEAAGAYRRFLQAALPGLDADDGLALLTADTHDPDPAVHDGAVRALCRWNGSAAIDPLLAVAGSTPDERHHLLAIDRALQLIAQQADRAKDRDDDDRLAQVRQWYAEAAEAARRDEESTRIREAVEALDAPEADDS